MHIPDGPILVGVAHGDHVHWQYPPNFPVEDSAIPEGPLPQQLEYIRNEHVTPHSLAQFAAIAVVFPGDVNGHGKSLKKAGFEEVPRQLRGELAERFGTDFSQIYFRNIPLQGQNLDI